MHSSRMRTARLLPVSPTMHCFGGSGPAGGLLLGGGFWSGEVSGPGGCLVWESVSQHELRQTPPL